MREKGASYVPPPSQEQGLTEPVTSEDAVYNTTVVLADVCTALQTHLPLYNECTTLDNVMFTADIHSYSL